MIRPRRAEDRDAQPEQVADDTLPVKVSGGALFGKCKTSPALKRTQPLILFTTASNCFRDYTGGTGMCNPSRPDALETLPVKVRRGCTFWQVYLLPCPNSVSRIVSGRCAIYLYIHFLKQQ